MNNKKIIAQKNGSCRVEIGQVIQSSRNGPFEVIEYNNYNNVVVRFIETGTITSGTLQRVSKGQIRDFKYPMYYGVGYKGLGAYRFDGKGVGGPLEKKAYSAWSFMLERCYGSRKSKLKHYKDRNVTVDPTWFDYQNFADWYIRNYKVECQLDKDLLSNGIGRYSPETCCFLPPTINVLLKATPKDIGALPNGVCATPSGKYQVQMKIGGKTRRLGIFSKAHTAFLVYKDAKERYISDEAHKALVDGLIDQRVHTALLNFKIMPYGRGRVCET